MPDRNGLIGPDIVEVLKNEIEKGIIWVENAKPRVNQLLIRQGVSKWKLRLIARADATVAELVSHFLSRSASESASERVMTE